MQVEVTTRASDLSSKVLAIYRIAFVAVALLCGCASLPETSERTPSFALPASTETLIGRVAAVSVPTSEASGFRLMHAGPLALEGRLQLIANAERSLDVQYYHIQNDRTGRQFLGALGEAAARGVRVRLLIDDLYTGGEDEVLAGLLANGNFEVRLFNPFPTRARTLLGRFAGSLHELDRVQRRMHNKLLVADGAMAITGGRNIGDEYYWASPTSVFFDFDVLLAGPVVTEFAAHFDRYWNSPFAHPAKPLLRSGSMPVTGSGLSNRVEEGNVEAVQRLTTDLLGYGALAEELVSGKVRLHLGAARAFADEPEKITQGHAGSSAWESPSAVRQGLNTALQSAQDEVMLVTPYAVPGELGMERIRSARARGVQVSVLTNSLASTDEPVVHTGYRRYREEMLRFGAELYELHPRRTKRLTLASFPGDIVLRVHTKTAVVDRRVVFIGSLNLDQRSANLNTEIGLLVDSPELARDILALVGPLKRDGAYRLTLDSRGRLEWRATSEVENLDEVWRGEPQSSWWQRFWLEVLSLLVPESLL